MIAIFGALTFVCYIANQLFMMWTFPVGDPILESQELLFWYLTLIFLVLTVISFIAHIYFNRP
jgi:hypothetical protein